MFLSNNSNSYSDINFEKLKDGLLSITKSECMNTNIYIGRLEARVIKHHCLNWTNVPSEDG